MALTYDRPVTYQSHMFNPHSDFEHNLNIKIEPHSAEYFSRDSSYALYSHDSSMDELRLKHKQVLSQSDPEELLSWTRKHPQHWTRREVLDWIYFVVEQEHLDGSRLQGEAYNNFVGEDLCKMDRKQFMKADPYYGSKMFETFRNLINDVSFEEPKSEAEVGCLDTFNIINNMEYTDLNRNICKSVAGKSHGNNNKDDTDLMVYHSDNDIKVNLTGLGVYSISPEIELPVSYSVIHQKLKEGESFTRPLAPWSPSQLLQFSSSSSSHVPSCTKHRSSSSSSMYTSTSSSGHPYISSTHPRKINSSPRPNNLSSSFRTSSSSSRPSVSLSVSSGSLPQPLLYSSPSSPCRLDKCDLGYLSDDSCSSNMPPYRPPSMNNMSYSEDIHMDMNHPSVFLSTSYLDTCVVPKKKDKKNRNNATKNGNHLWEFVRDLLKDPKTNPKLLKWEDKEHGVFRFVQSEKVAQLWGEKKNNPLMTYEKLSRAMRFCRSAGYFDSVPKTGKYPKKLCFRFGEKARGWKD